MLQSTLNRITFEDKYKGLQSDTGLLVGPVPHGKA